MAVDHDLLPPHRRIAPELRLPEWVAQHGDVVPALVLIVVRGEQPSERGPDTKEGEIRARDEKAPAVDGGLARHRDVHAEEEMTGDAAEGRVRALEVTEHRIAKDLVAAPCAIAGIRTIHDARILEIDELL